MAEKHGKRIDFTISIAVLNNLEFTRKCLEQIDALTFGAFEVIISDNGSTDGTAQFLAEYCQRHDNCRIISYAYNTGFGYPHNKALSLARGEYFVVINNDVFIYEPGWLEKLATQFTENLKLAIVGFAGGYSALDEMGRGVKDPSRLEYVEGSCLMIPKKLADSFGLFAEEYELGYWEDVDLSLRYRQIGYDIQLVSCAHEHIANATSSTIDKALFARVRDRNYKTFRKRWSGYLHNRSFSGRVLVRAVTDCLDSLLAVTAVLGRLKDEQPLVNFHLITNRPDIFVCHPAVDLFFLPDKATDNEGYDRVIDFDFRNLPLDQPVVLTLADQAAVTIDRVAPVLYLDPSVKDMALPFMAPRMKYVVLSILTSDDRFDQITDIVRNAGYEAISVESLDDGRFYRIDDEAIVEFRELVKIIHACSLFIGFCEAPLKVAQAIGVPSIAVLKHGEDPFVKGVDSIRSCWVLPGVDIVLHLQHFLSAQVDCLQDESAFLQRALLNRVAQFNSLWSGYRDLKEREQSLDAALINQALLTEQVATAYEKLETHLQCKLLEFEQASIERERIISDLDRRINSLENSLIWRITKPIRLIMDHIFNAKI